MYIDTHSHLYVEEFAADREQVIQRAREARVEKIILPDIDSQTRFQMLELCDAYPDLLFPLIGLHPTSVNADYKKELHELEHQLGLRKYYGIGECGIDLYWDKTYFKEQVKVFEYQMGIARELNLPIIIHARESLEEIFSSLKKYPYITGIFHCFSGNTEQAKQAIDMGFLLGIGGVVTFKNTQLDKVLLANGLSSIVLETDSPYLSPVPYRGKRNESSYIPLIAQKIADILKEDLKKIEKITTQNAMNLFTLHTEIV
ncbi:TatD family hydrolase [uncultured Odoribacter sp.]|uniref:TatD family hydrolase n=1 Tax=uncultured Odoribacter sp. TaxID=876416 RepID=UPI00261523F1|nr:TatD family hydrolase [uncultured Odoribacter sp.]